MVLPQEVLDIFIRRLDHGPTRTARDIAALQSLRLVNHACSDTATPLLFNTLTVGIADRASEEKMISLSYNQVLRNLVTVVRFDLERPHPGVPKRFPHGVAPSEAEIARNSQFPLRILGVYEGLSHFPCLQHVSIVGAKMLSPQSANAFTCSVRIYACINALTHHPYPQLNHISVDSTFGLDKLQYIARGRLLIPRHASIFERNLGLVKTLEIGGFRWNDDHFVHKGTALASKMSGLESLILNDLDLAAFKQSPAGPNLLPGLRIKNLVLTEFRSSQVVLDALIADTASTLESFAVQKSKISRGTWDRIFLRLAGDCPRLLDVEIGEEVSLTESLSWVHDLLQPGRDRTWYIEGPTQLIREDAQALLSLLKRVEANREDAALPKKYDQKVKYMESRLAVRTPQAASHLVPSHLGELCNDIIPAGNLCESHLD